MPGSCPTWARLARLDPEGEGGRNDEVYKTNGRRGEGRLSSESDKRKMFCFAILLCVQCL